MWQIPYKTHRRQDDKIKCTTEIGEKQTTNNKQICKKTRLKLTSCTTSGGSERSLLSLSTMTSLATPSCSFKESRLFPPHCSLIVRHFSMDFSTLCLKSHLGATTSFAIFNSSRKESLRCLGLAPWPEQQVLMTHLLSFAFFSKFLFLAWPSMTAFASNRLWTKEPLLAWVSLLIILRLSAFRASRFLSSTAISSRGFRLLLLADLAFLLLLVGLLLLGGCVYHAYVSTTIKRVNMANSEVKVMNMFLKKLRSWWGSKTRRSSSIATGLKRKIWPS